jgi:hypothetical protein
MSGLTCGLHHWLCQASNLAHPRKGIELAKDTDNRSPLTHLGDKPSWNVADAGPDREAFFREQRHLSLS